MLGKYHASTNAPTSAAAMLSPNVVTVLPKLTQSCDVSGIFSRVTSTRLATTSRIPEIPVTPKPGMTKISTPISTNPRMKSSTARNVNSPTNEYAQKNSTKQTADSTPGNVVPGIF